MYSVLSQRGNFGSCTTGKSKVSFSLAGSKLMQGRYQRQRISQLGRHATVEGADFFWQGCLLNAMDPSPPCPSCNSAPAQQWRCCRAALASQDRAGRQAC